MISGTIPPHITHFNDIGDVNIPAPIDGYFVYWDAAAGKWQCQHVVTTVDHLNDIGDVNVPPPVGDGKILYWDDAAGKWQSKAESVFSCADLAACSPNALHGVFLQPTNKWIVHFNMATTRWEAQALSNWSLLELGTKELDNLDNVNVPAPTDQYFLYWDGVAGKWQCRALIGAIEFVIDGGGSVIATGLKMGFEIPFACTITRATLIAVLPADTAGSIVIDIWKTTYADVPPKDANSITASAPPTITAAKKSQDSTLTGWTTAIAAGGVLFVNVDSCSTFTCVTLSLKVEKS